LTIRRRTIRSASTICRMSELSVTYAEVAPRWMIPFAEGRLEAVGVDVGHHIVPDLALPPLGVLVIDVARVRTQLGDLRLGDREPQLLLRFGQRDPEAAPRPELEIGGEEVRHLPRRVPLGQRVGGSVSLHERIILMQCPPFRRTTLAGPRK